MNKTEVVSESSCLTSHLPEPQESCTVAIDVQHLSSTRRYEARASNRGHLQHPVQSPVFQAPKSLNPAQSATLHALVSLFTTSGTAHPSPIFSPPFEHEIGLDELDALARTHAAFPFAELPPDLQDAMLHLIAARNLTTRKLDLALWLEELRNEITDV
jgi:hypothetical protein